MAKTPINGNNYERHWVSTTSNGGDEKKLRDKLRILSGFNFNSGRDYGSDIRGSTYKFLKIKYSGKDGIEALAIGSLKKEEITIEKENEDSDEDGKENNHRHKQKHVHSLLEYAALAFVLTHGFKDIKIFNRYPADMLEDILLLGIHDKMRIKRNGVILKKDKMNELLRLIDMYG